MPVLGAADAIYVGSTRADAVYMGATKVWSSSPFTPDGLVAWLAAEDYTGTTWPNRAGVAPAIVGTPAMTAGVPLNGLPTVRFKPNEGRIRSAPWTDPVQDFTVIYQVRFVGPSVGRAFTVQYPPSNLLVGIHSSGYDQMYDNGEWRQGPAWGNWPTTWTMYGADSATGAGAAFFVNGAQIGTRTPGGAGFTNGWAISGYSPTGAEETMDIEIAEVLIWNRRLTDPERVQAETYLRAKRGLS